MRKLADLDTRKELLIAQAEFDRLKLAMAAHDVRRILRPTARPAQARAAHSIAARVLGIALPILGRSRVGRVVRGLSIALSIYRFLRGFAAR